MYVCNMIYQPIYIIAMRVYLGTESWFMTHPKALQYTYPGLKIGSGGWFELSITSAWPNQVILDLSDDWHWPPASDLKLLLLEVHHWKQTSLGKTSIKGPAVQILCFGGWWYTRSVHFSWGCQCLDDAVMLSSVPCPPIVRHIYRHDDPEHTWKAAEWFAANWNSHLAHPVVVSTEWCKMDRTGLDWMSLCLAEHVVLWTRWDRFHGSIVGANMSKSPAGNPTSNTALEIPCFQIWEIHL